MLLKGIRLAIEAFGLPLRGIISFGRSPWDRHRSNLNYYQPVPNAGITADNLRILFLNALLTAGGCGQSPPAKENKKRSKSDTATIKQWQREIERLDKSIDFLYQLEPE